MPRDPEILLERIERQLELLDKSAYWLSMEITGGKRNGVITDLRRKPFMPKEPRLRAMAKALNTTVEYLTGESDNPAPMLSEVGVADRLLDWRGQEPHLPGIPLVGTGDCADLEVRTETGDTVHVERSSFEADYVVRFIERPMALRGNDKAYAIYFHGSSMEPRFFAGEVGIVDPTRPCAPGDFVIVQLNDGESDDVVSVLVKRLIRQSSREVVLEQYNPALTFSVPRSRVRHLHRIVPPTEQLLL